MKVGVSSALPSHPDIPAWNSLPSSCSIQQLEGEVRFGLFSVVFAHLLKNRAGLPAFKFYQVQRQGPTAADADAANMILKYLF